MELRLEETERENLHLKTQLKNMELKHLNDVCSNDFFKFLLPDYFSIMILS